MNVETQARATESLQRFFGQSIDEVLGRHLRADPEGAALALFHDAAASVPAYRTFLAERGVIPAMVRTFSHFKALPLTAKASYVAERPLASLVRGGNLAASDMLAVSSGSTGRPTFWPRALADEFHVAMRFEQVFHDSFEADRRPTLAIICFALGTWVGGMFTTACCRHLAVKGYPVTTVTPGNNKDEILRVFADLAPAFEQVVLLGYPPFLKDVIDTGRARGIDWSRHRIRLVTAGEVFSEAWRTLVAERVGADDLLRFCVSLYGTADGGVLGNETPLSTAIRRFLAERPEAARRIFGNDRLPTLAQYDPLSRFFEVKNGTLLFTADGTAPLVRYHISDEGGLYRCDALLAALAEEGFDPFEVLGPEARGVRPLPFVYVFGRSHFTVSFFGANVFPENVSLGLEGPAVRDFVTGKFVLEVKEGADRDTYLSVTVELAPGEVTNAGREAAVAEAIAAALVRQNSEYANYVPEERRVPRVVLLPHGDPEQFPAGVKHRYTR
ncbi:phenylacetate--CoA ligase family protein [Polyangium aurulentum]|uniref:phenylacetate--CoA ligase family protein n=1 Tax=Polyangium aurulentum TaxID=2567896 RepID=UPI0010AE6251|nr:phenylacetate--CoA ligase family protein [Polyangium aurulentum]UQA60048.1 phenylacetate--CoA ligase family protein [Polyangium aurulentum]